MVISTTYFKSKKVKQNKPIFLFSPYYFKGPNTHLNETLNWDIICT